MTWFSVKRSNSRQFPLQFQPSLFKKENQFSLLILLNLSPGSPLLLSTAVENSAKTKADQGRKTMVGLMEKAPRYFKK